MIGDIVSFAGDSRLWVVTSEYGRFLTCTLVGDDSKRVACKRDQLKFHNLESLLQRYEGMNARSRAASFAHRLPQRRLDELKFLKHTLRCKSRQY